MKLSVASILQSQHDTNRHGFNELLPLIGDGERIEGPVVGELEITRIAGHMLQLKGQFKAQVHMVCDRCGNDFGKPIAFSLEEALEVTDEPITAEEVEERVASDGVLDASDLIRQSLLLALPARRLCGCEPQIAQADDASSSGAGEKLDPRWAALQALNPETNGHP